MPSNLADDSPSHLDDWRCAASTELLNARRQDRLRYGMFAIANICQLITLVISWPVWNPRETPDLLPLVALPELSFGIPLVITLLLAMIWPRAGTVLHAIVLTAAIVADQHRLQPQVLSLLVLMAGCAFDDALRLARWYLIAMWLWAGLHKLLSPEWLGFGAWHHLNESGLPADDWYLAFAITVAVAEIVLGLTAIIAPRWASIGCVLLHLGVLLLLSPLFRDYNHSVWPWNIATAIVGAWMLRRELPPVMETWERVGIATLLIAPAGFYMGWVNPHLAFVLYSGHLPHACHTSAAGHRSLDGWGAFNVPFPDSPRLFRQHFVNSAQVGDKLCIDDPRPWGSRQYYVKEADGSLRELSRVAFHHSDSATGEIAGVELARPEIVWQIKRSDITLTYDERQQPYSAILTDNSANETNLTLLGQLPSLRELHVIGGSLAPMSYECISHWPMLEIVSISNGELDDSIFPVLARCRTLTWIECQGVTFKGDGLLALAKLPKLEVLLLPKTTFDDEHLAQVASLANLNWLDLQQARLPPQGMAPLAKLSNLQRLNLSDSDVQDSELLPLLKLTRLHTLRLNNTELTDAAVATLRQFPHLRHLELMDTKFSAAARDQLREALPDCLLIW